jgi:Mycobacterium membrane protein
MLGVLKRVWMPVVIVIVLVIGGLTVSRIRTFFGAEDRYSSPAAPVEDTEPFDPKVVKYEIWGDGTYADVNYLDLDAEPQRVDGAGLPWTLVLESTAPSVFPNIVAQGDSSTITCRITVDDEVKDERTTSGVNAQTFCLVKSA